MINIEKEVASLRRMTVNELRERYKEVCGEESRSRNKPFLWKRIAWRIQALEEGGLSERARKRAMELAKDAEIRIRPPRDAFRAQGGPNPERTEVRSYSTSNVRRIPLPGTVLTRDYRGETIRVTVLEKGFEWEGQVYRSLTAVANAATGSHWNGYGFFGLLDKGGNR